MRVSTAILCVLIGFALAEIVRTPPSPAPLAAGPVSAG